VRVALVLLGALVAQQAVLSQVRVAGVGPDLLLLVAVAAGVAGGPEAGAVVGFAAGVAADLLIQAPFGLSSLAFGLVGYGVGTLQAGVIRLAWWIPPATALAASAAGVLLYGLLGGLLGQAGMLRSELAGLAGVVGLLNAPLVPLATRAVRWALAGGREAALAR